MTVLTDRGRYLISGAVASGAAASTALDNRIYANHAYVAAMATVESALVSLQVSHDNATWMEHSLITALTTTGTAQVTDYLPYVRAVINTRWGASTANVFYAPGLRR